MKKAVIGILAHVDAGKTTLSEGLLYLPGSIRKFGRVDHQDAFLDNFSLERQRGITIFSKQAVLTLGDLEVTLLDTPGHVDFSAEMERTLQVLDYAVLVVSGTDGIQAHTLTLWRLLERYQIPVFLFINKMDLPGADADVRMAELRRRLSEGCLAFDRMDDAFYEAAALTEESAMDEYLTDACAVRGDPPGAHCRTADLPLLFSAPRCGFPAWKNSSPVWNGGFSRLSGPRLSAPRSYKISRDTQGARLTHLKVTGGVLRVRDLLTGCRPGGSDAWEEKADQLRIYSGGKYTTVNEVPAGGVCAVTGLSQTYPGQGLGIEAESEQPALEPVLTYRVGLPQGPDAHTALGKLRQLEEEDPQLHLLWNESLGGDPSAAHGRGSVGSPADHDPGAVRLPGAVRSRKHCL